ncbi:MAG: hypothetical protein J7496_01675 [Novosphingobium sp.]|nr:hypothetical protein [Novosphingobium sp.]
MKGILAVAGFAMLASAGGAALANNVGENYAWQFQTTTDKVNQAAIADMIEKKKSGYYSPPVYNTTIERQYNCSIASTATGNEGTNTNLANSPTTSGPSADATGNSSDSNIDGWKGDNQALNDQTNSGHVGASVDGSVSTHVSGSPNQALNSDQNNTGNQTASVDGSTACSFSHAMN